MFNSKLLISSEGIQCEIALKARYPRVNCDSLLLKVAIEIVDLPIENGGFFHSYASLPEEMGIGNLLW